MMASVRASGPVNSKKAALLIAIIVSGCSGEPTRPAGPSPSAISVVSGNEQIGVVGSELSAPLVIRVTDQGGRPLPGQSVTFRVLAGGGSLLVPSMTTDTDGLAQDRW